MFKFTDQGGPLRCSFCGKVQQQTAKLIAGPGVYICDECIRLCMTLIQEEMGGEPGTFRFAARRADGTLEKVEVHGVQWKDGQYGALQQCNGCGGWLAGVGWTECAHCGAALTHPEPPLSQG